LLEKSDGIGSCGYPPLEAERTAGSDSQLGSAEGRDFTGLSDIPASWASCIRANASLQAEIGWCRSLWDFHYMSALFQTANVATLPPTDIMSVVLGAAELKGDQVDYLEFRCGQVE
jgi:hypothetical protein